MPSKHSWGLVALNVATIVILCIVFFFNGVSSGNIVPGLFLNNTGAISDLYYLEITPAGWTFSIWGFIYTWQVLWIAYVTINIFRQTPEGPLYVNPINVSVATFTIYIFNLLLNISWLLLWDRQYLQVALPVLALIAITLYLCLVLTYRALYANTSTMLKQGLAADVWMVRMFVHNGFAIYATWTTIATLLNLASVIAYWSYPAISQSTASTIALAILSVEIVVFVGTDLFLCDKYSRYTFTPYLVIVVALIGSLARNWDPTKTNSIFTAVLLAIGGLVFVLKIFFIFWRHKREPVVGILA